MNNFWALNNGRMSGPQFNLLAGLPTMTAIEGFPGSQ